jgi:glycosyltransferase involved in cell wall biosynthesis
VAATLESALAQTWANKEIIVIDDGSTDSSLTILRAFEARGVQVIDQPNRGASAARNTGLRAARGEYIQFLDADDLLAPDKIERQLRVLTRPDAAALASASWARFQGDPAQAIFTPFPNWRDLTGVEFLQLHYEEICMMHPAAWLARRELLDTIGPWNEALSLNDDGEYFARAMLAAKQIVFCEDARSFYRSQIDGSLSGRKDSRALASLFKSVELTVGHLLSADRSPRSRAATAFAWKWTAFELYPASPELSRIAEQNARSLGGSVRPFPAGGRFQLASHLLGWRMAKRLFT